MGAFFMQRIMIFGGSGSGKSTLARELGARTGLPVVHIDPMYWKAGWVQRDPAESLAMIRNAMAAPQWVFEGNHSGTLDDRAAMADVIIYLDMPLYVRLWRFTKRWWTYRNQTRPDMTEGCNERWDPVFVRDFILRHGRRKRPAHLARIAGWRDQGHKVVILNRPKQVAELLENWPKLP